MKKFTLKWARYDQKVCFDGKLSQDDGENNEGNVVIDTSTREKGHASAKRQPEMQVGKG